MLALARRDTRTNVAALLLLHRFEIADFYIREAKKLKHVADKKVDKEAKLYSYIEAVQSFILCGYAMELSNASEHSKIFKMYQDTFKMLQ